LQSCELDLVAEIDDFVQRNVGRFCTRPAGPFRVDEFKRARDRRSLGQASEYFALIDQVDSRDVGDGWLANDVTGRRKDDSRNNRHPKNSVRQQLHGEPAEYPPGRQEARVPKRRHVGMRVVTLTARFHGTMHPIRIDLPRMQGPAARVSRDHECDCVPLRQDRVVERSAPGNECDVVVDSHRLQNRAPQATSGGCFRVDQVIGQPVLCSLENRVSLYGKGVRNYLSLTKNPDRPCRGGAGNKKRRGAEEYRHQHLCPRPHLTIVRNGRDVERAASVRRRAASQNAHAPVAPTKPIAKIVFTHSCHSGAT
jgi:hypothetical protein